MEIYDRLEKNCLEEKLFPTSNLVCEMSVIILIFIDNEHFIYIYILTLLLSYYLSFS